MLEKRNIEAKKELENIIAVEEFKVPEDEQATHYSFYNYNYVYNLNNAGRFISFTAPENGIYFVKGISKEKTIVN